MTAYLREQHPNKQISFYNALAERIAKTTHASNTKDAKSNFINKYKAIHDYKFIRFNTKNWVQVLVFDIDNVSESAKHWFREFEDGTGFKPSYVSKTDNGVQVGLFLKEKHYITDYDGNDNVMRSKLSLLKKAIALKVRNIDDNGTNRLLGVWRNPIVHDTIASDAVYDLKTLLKAFSVTSHNPTQRNTLISPTMNIKMNISKEGHVQRVIEDGFYEGNRNNYIFSFGMKLLFENRSLLNSIESLMQKENGSYSNPLTEKEVYAIAQNVIKFSSTMYQPKNLYKKHAKHEKFMRDNNIHGLFNRQSFGAFKTAEVKRERTTGEIVNAILDLFQKGITEPTNRQLTELTGIGIRQWQRLKREYNLKAIFALFVNNLFSTHPIDIRANVTPITERIFKGINKQIMKCEKTGKVFINYVFDGSKWVKPWNDEQLVA